MGPRRAGGLLRNTDAMVLRHPAGVPVESLEVIRAELEAAAIHVDLAVGSRHPVADGDTVEVAT